MMRSLSSAVAGLRTHQTKMDVIGNNIANVNTYGFKSSRVTFSDVYYQNLSGASSPSTSSGGKNPTQIGYGSSVATIDVMQGVANMSSTNRAMDVYIAGDGFLVSKDANGTFKYTRLGNLGFDADGNLVDANGNFVQGFPLAADGSPIIGADGTVASDALRTIHVDPLMLDKLTGIEITSSGAIVGLLPGDTVLQLSNSTNPDWINSAATTITDDSTYRGDITLAISGYVTASQLNIDLGWTAGPPANPISKVEMGNMPLPAGGYSVSVVGNEMTMTIKDADGKITTLVGTLKDGKIVLKEKGSNSKIGLTLTVDPAVKSLATLAPVTDKPGTLSYYMQLTTKDKGGNKVTLGSGSPLEDPQPFDWTKTSFGNITLTLTRDPTKDPTNPALDSDFRGFNEIIGRSEAQDGSAITLGNLVLAKFRNAAGLKESGTSTFEKTSNSGDAIYTLPGLEGTGDLAAGNLEMSNVDLSREMTDMITTQRGFQANSRIITVSDSMLEELVNLKR